MPASLHLGAFRRLAPGIDGQEGVAVDRAGNVYGGDAHGYTDYPTLDAIPMR